MGKTLLESATLRLLINSVSTMSRVPKAVVGMFDKPEFQTAYRKSQKEFLDVFYEEKAKVFFPKVSMANFAPIQGLSFSLPVTSTRLQVPKKVVEFYVPGQCGSSKKNVANVLGCL